MTEIRFYDQADDRQLRFAVIVTKTGGRWVFCKHRERSTLEVPGGHREPGEDILTTAKRELREETGAVDFGIEPVCVYSVTAPGNFGGRETFGMLFYADVKTFEKELHSEIERIVVQDGLPTAWTYPEIQPRLIDETLKRRAVAYRRLTADDLETFIAMRIAQLREEGATEELDLTPALMDYYRRHLADETFVSWLAVNANRIVGTSGMSFVEKPPYFGCPSGRIGLLSSMYTDPLYRRQGIAKKLLGLVVEEARARGCGSVQITASDMGVLLYRDFGFVKNDNFMQFRL